MPDVTADLLNVLFIIFGLYAMAIVAYHWKKYETFAAIYSLILGIIALGIGLIGVETAIYPFLEEVPRGTYIAVANAMLIVTGIVMLAAAAYHIKRAKVGRGVSSVSAGITGIIFGLVGMDAVLLAIGSEGAY